MSASFCSSYNCESEGLSLFMLRVDRLAAGEVCEKLLCGERKLDLVPLKSKVARVVHRVLSLDSVCYL